MCGGGEGGGYGGRGAEGKDSPRGSRGGFGWRKNAGCVNMSMEGVDVCLEVRESGWNCVDKALERDPSEEGETGTAERSQEQADYGDYARSTVRSKFN